MIDVVVADDHALVREGICALLARSADIHVVGQASNGEEAIQLVNRLLPQVLVIDVSMKKMDGLQATRLLLSQNSKVQVVVLSMFGDPLIITQAFRSGARAYLLKESLPEELPTAIRAAANRQTFLSLAIPHSVIEKATQNEDLIDSITPREHQVLQLVAEGNTSKSIGYTLGISEKTVEKHRTKLRQKLHVEDTVSLIRTALENQLIFSERDN